MFSWTVHEKGSPKEDGAAVAVNHKLYYFGRNSDENSEDQIGVQVFNTVSLEWRKLPPMTPVRGKQPPEVPSSRVGHTAVLIGKIVYIWGGRTCDLQLGCNVLYAFDVNTHGWFKPQVSGSVPEVRYHHSACDLGKVMFIHGGEHMYKLDTSTMVWSITNTRAWLSLGHSATIIGTKMFVFGGWGGVYRNSIRVFDTETDCYLYLPSTPRSPEGRWSHSAFAYNGELYIFGGCADWDQTFSDLWKFNPESFSWKKVEPKGKGLSPTYDMCCCMVGDRIFLFGGYKTPDDLYVLDLCPSLKTLCKLAVIQYGLDHSELPHNVRWELAAMPKPEQHKLNSKPKTSKTPESGDNRPSGHSVT